MSWRNLALICRPLGYIIFVVFVLVTTTFVATGHVDFGKLSVFTLILFVALAGLSTEEE